MNRQQKRQADRMKRNPTKPKRAPKVYVRTKPTLADMEGVFNKIDVMFTRIRTGYVDTVNGVPIMSDGQGDLIAIAPALHGWCELWDRIATRYGLILQTGPLTIMANRLEYGTPLTMELIDRSQAVIDRCRKIYAQLDVYEVRSMVNTQCIKYEFENLKGGM